MNQTKRNEILRRLQQNNPHPTTELNFSSLFELLIVVLLLLPAQATDVSTARLYPVAKTPAAMLALVVDGVKEYIKAQRRSGVILTREISWALPGFLLLPRRRSQIHDRHHW